MESNTTPRAFFDPGLRHPGGMPDGSRWSLGFFGERPPELPPKSYLTPAGGMALTLDLKPSYPIAYGEAGAAQFQTGLGGLAVAFL